MEKRLSQLAVLGGFSLPAKGNNVIINALEADHQRAAPGMLTYIAENSPASIYRCKASAVLVNRYLGQMIPRDEGEVIPVDNPEEVFNRLVAALGQ